MNGTRAEGCLLYSVLVGDGDCIRGRTRCLLKSYNTWSSLVIMLGPLSEGNFGNFKKANKCEHVLTYPLFA